MDARDLAKRATLSTASGACAYAALSIFGYGVMASGLPLAVFSIGVAAIGFAIYRLID